MKSAMAAWGSDGRPKFAAEHQKLAATLDSLIVEWCLVGQRTDNAADWWRPRLQPVRAAAVQASVPIPSLAGPQQLAAFAASWGSPATPGHRLTQFVIGRYMLLAQSAGALGLVRFLSDECGCAVVLVEHARYTYGSNCPATALDLELPMPLPFFRRCPMDSEPSGCLCQMVRSVGLGRRIA